MRRFDDTPGGGRFRAFASVLLVLVVTAGGLGAVTQSSLDADTTAVDSASFPPGASADRIENTSRLVAGHRSVLAETGSFAISQRINATRPPGSPQPTRWVWNQTASQQFDVSASPPRFAQERRVARPDTTVRMRVVATPTVWHTELRTADATNSHTRARNLTHDEFQQWALDHGLDTVLERYAFSYAGRDERGNRTLYRYESTAYYGERSRGLRSLPSEITAANATLVVDDRGLITYFDHQYTGTSVATTESGTNVRMTTTVSYRWSFETLETTTIEDPRADARS